MVKRAMVDSKQVLVMAAVLFHKEKKNLVRQWNEDRPKKYSYVLDTTHIEVLSQLFCSLLSGGRERMACNDFFADRAPP